MDPCYPLATEPAPSAGSDEGGWCVSPEYLRKLALIITSASGAWSAQRTLRSSRDPEGPLCGPTTSRLARWPGF